MSWYNNQILDRLKGTLKTDVMNNPSRELGQVTVKNQNNESSNDEFVFEDIMWVQTWGSSCAVHHNGKVYVAGVGRDFNIKIGSYDFETKETVITSLDELTDVWDMADDHTKPAIIVFPDGKIGVFYTAHDEYQYVGFRKSINAEDISEMGAEVQINTGGFCTYTHAQMYHSPKKLYLWSRVLVDGVRGWNLMVSTNDGDTWSDPIRFTNETYMHMGQQEQGHPVAGFTLGDHGQTTGDLAYGVVHFPTGEIRRADATVVANINDTSTLPISRTDLTTVIVSNNISPIVPWDVVATSNAPKYAVVFIDYPNYPLYDVHRLNYACWNETDQAFRVNPIFEDGGGGISVSTWDHYGGGMCFDIERASPDTVIASVQEGDAWQIYRCRTNRKKNQDDGWGENWYKERITDDDTLKNIRPLKVLDAPGGERKYRRMMPFVWLRGYYIHYRDFYTWLEYPFKKPN